MVTHINLNTMKTKNFKIDYKENNKIVSVSIVKAYNLKDASNCANYYIKLHKWETTTFVITEL